MPRAHLGVFSLLLPLALVGCQLLLDTNAPAERVVVLAPGELAVADAGASSRDAASAAGRVCPPSTFCEWFDTPSLGRWTVTPGAGAVVPDTKDVVSAPYSLFVHVLPGAPSFVGFAEIERARVTGVEPVNAAALEVQMKLDAVPLGQVVSLLALDASARSTDFSASIDLRQDGRLSFVVMKDDTTVLVDDTLPATLEGWHRYWLKIDAANAQFSWAVDGDVPQTRSLPIAAEPALFDVSAGLVWVQQTVTTELSMHYDDLKVSWGP